MFRSQKDSEMRRKTFLIFSPDNYLEWIKVTTDEKPSRVTSTWAFHLQIGLRCRQLEYDFACVFLAEKIKHKNYKKLK